MTTTSPLYFSLELNFEDERVAGRLGDEHGNHWPFSCWLDLLTLIDRVHAGAPLPADQLDPAEGSRRRQNAPYRRAVKGADGK
jgi:hypothetical protein